MISTVREIAKLCGISLVISNSEKNLETQLNSLTKEEDDPLLLVSWDVDTTLSFDENGFLENPATTFTCLLMEKASDLSKEELEFSAEKMGVLFTTLMQELYSHVTPTLKTNAPAIFNAGYKLVPRYGMGRHSGVLGRWSMRIPIKISC